MRILFMGTPEFALTSLEALYNAGHEICCVFTQPDKAKNRGMKLLHSPVKKFALSKNIPVFQPRGFKNGEASARIRDLKPDIIVVVAYGRILPADVLDIAAFGAINVHGSLLPKFRGSAPIQHAIMTGEKETGVCTMYMAPELDAGDIIDSVSTVIGEDETFGSLYDRLCSIGAALLLKTLTDIENGKSRRVTQDHTSASYAPPITKEDRVINWKNPACEVADRIRALDPAPGATAEFGGISYKLFSAYPTGKIVRLPYGKIVSADKEGLVVTCGGGQTLLIKEIQAAGGKRMSVEAYLRGHSIRE